MKATIDDLEISLRTMFEDLSYEYRNAKAVQSHLTSPQDISEAIHIKVAFAQAIEALERAM